MKALLQMFRVANQLENAHRYSQMQMTRDENVMEHTGFVCQFAYLLWMDLSNQSLTGQEPFDLGIALRKAVCHDLDEAITGDVPRTTKYVSEEIREAFAKVEREGVMKLRDALGLKGLTADLFFDNWDSAKGDREGLVIKYADLAAVVYRLWVEVILRRNMSFMPVALGVQKYLNQFRDSMISIYHRDTDDDGNRLHQVEPIQVLAGLLFTHSAEAVELVEKIVAMDDPLFHTLEQ